MMVQLCEQIGREQIGVTILDNDAVKIASIIFTTGIPHGYLHTHDILQIHLLEILVCTSCPSKSGNCLHLFLQV